VAVADACRTESVKGSWTIAFVQGCGAVTWTTTQRAPAPVPSGEQRSDLPVLPLATAVPNRRRRGPATAAIEEPKTKGERTNLLPEV
jgi:hypothetical protein